MCPFIPWSAFPLAGLMEAPKPMAPMTKEQIDNSIANLKSLIETHVNSGEVLNQFFSKEKEVGFYVDPRGGAFYDRQMKRYIEEPVQEVMEDPSLQRLEKEQRAKTSNKRHKQKIIHQTTTDGQVPSSLLMRLVPPPK